MKKAVLLKLYDDSHYDDWHNEFKLREHTDVFEIEDAEFEHVRRNLHRVPGQYQYEDNFRYAILEILPPEKLTDLKTHILGAIEADKRRAEEAARKREEAKRQKAEKELETKRKQLAKLKKELGEA